jgi:hypothetical protein
MKDLCIKERIKRQDMPMCDEDVNGCAMPRANERAGTKKLPERIKTFK